MGHEERFPLPRRVAAIGSVKGLSPEYPVTTGKRRQRTLRSHNRGGQTAIHRRPCWLALRLRGISLAVERNAPAPASASKSQFFASSPV